MKAIIINDPLTHITADSSSLEHIGLEFEYINMFEGGSGATNLNLDLSRIFDFQYISQSLVERLDFNQVIAIILPATKYLKMIGSRLSILLEIGIVADVISVELVENKMLLQRPAYEQQVVAAICCDTTPALFTYRHLQPSGQSDQQIEQLKMLVGDEVTIDNGQRKLNLSEYNIVIGCGYGFGNNFDKIEKLREKLDFGLATTKKVTEAGWADYSHQVGLSGKIIKPELYIALGVEGAIHHIVGIEESQIIISVNVNPRAAINSISDYYLKQDCVSFVEQLYNIL